tara:strand:+ start:300 stop:479 length:180 start_codon:yes stop_codon:yes gene_type:complete
MLDPFVLNALIILPISSLIVYILVGVWLSYANRKKLFYRSEEDEADLLNWDAEKYIQSM